MIRKLANLSLVLLTIILALAIYIIVKKPEVVYIFDREKQLMDSLALINSRLDSSQKRVAAIQAQYDSLSNIEQEVIYNTREKIKFIYTTATPSQLDSIIRSAWKPRHY